jgi:Raf kinase inhibitor-like YbhB/YbcL family protein
MATSTTGEPMVPVLLRPNSEKRVRPDFRRASAALLFLLVLLLSCRRQPSWAHGQTHVQIAIQSSDFSSGGAIPQRFTCDGAGLSPSLQWAAPPAGTKSIALVMHDPDAMIDFTHWLAFNIPPGVRSIAEGASGQSTMPPGSSEGTNDFDRAGYGGPCPPGSKPHRYVIQIYALDTRLALQSGATRKQLDSAMSGHILAEGEISGTYRRTGQ